MAKKLKSRALGGQNVELSEEKEDRLSDLPDSLIHHILSFMETKHAVQTSLLSKRWRYLWKSTPDLNLSSVSFSKLSNFKGFVRWVLSMRGASGVRKPTYFRRGIGMVTDQSLLDKVVEYAVLHGVNKINIDLDPRSSIRPVFRISSSLFTCHSLDTLELKNCFATSSTKSPGCKTLTSLYLDFFYLVPAEEGSLDIFSYLTKLFSFATLTTLHISFFMTYDTGIEQWDPFASCVNLKNLELNGFTFSSYTCTKVFVVSAPQLVNLTMKCNTFNCKLEQLRNSYHHQKQRTLETVPDLINMLRGLHNAESVTLESGAVMVLYNIAVLLKHECSPFSELKSLKLRVLSTCQSHFKKLDLVTAYFRKGSLCEVYAVITTRSEPRSSSPCGYAVVSADGNRLIWKGK